jgi:nitrogen regulatory protein PII 2
MKEIVAVIRPRRVGATKEALDGLGYPSLTAVSVLGRGKQKGLASEVLTDLPPDAGPGKSGGMKYVPKRLLSLVVPDACVDEVIEAIMAVNRSDTIGDGKIFVCPVGDAMRVRTDECGESAVL